jgi:hypothetical protein
MDKAAGVGGDLKGTLMELGAALGVTVGVKALAQEMINANAEIEQTEKKLGGLLSGLYKFNKDPAANFRAGITASTRMIEALDEAEGEIGVDKSELLQTAQRLLPAFAAAGKSIEDTTDFTVKFSDISKQLGQNAEMSSMYVMQMLQYGMVPRRSPLFQAIGVSREEMKKLKTEGQRFDYLMKKLRVFKPDEMRKVETFKEKMEKIEIVVGNVYEDAGKPLFAAAKSAADDLLKSLKANDDQLKKVAEDIGKKVGGGLKVAAKGAGFVLDNFEALYDSAAAIGTIIVGWKVLPAVIGLAEGIAARLGVGAIGTLIAGYTAGALALATAVGLAIGQAIVSIWKHMGIFDLITDVMSGGKFAQMQRENMQMESQQAQARAQFRTEMAAHYGAMSKAAAQRELQEKYNMVTQEATREDLMQVAKSLGLDTNVVKSPEARGGGNTIFNNNRFDIKQDFAEGFDPDRIAVAFASDLARLGEMKMQSSLSPIGAMR